MAEAKYEIEDRDSEEVLLEEVQSTASSMTPQPCGEQDPDSEREAKERQERAVRAWTKLAEKMVCVVRTVQKNEQAMAGWTKHMKRLVLAVWVAMALAVLAAFYLAMQAEQAVNNLHRQTVQSMGKMAEQQKGTLDAVNKLSEAVGLKLEADTDGDPATDEEAKRAALDAQKAALEAKKQASDNPAERAEADRKIRKVEAKKDKGDVAPPPQSDYDPPYEDY